MAGGTSVSLSPLQTGNLVTYFFKGRLQCLIEKGWTGRGPSKTKAHRSAGASAYRIKVDDHRGIMIVTSRAGGLLVTDLTEDRVLWSLPEASILMA